MTNLKSIIGILITWSLAGWVGFVLGEYVPIIFAYGLTIPIFITSIAAIFQFKNALPKARLLLVLGVFLLAGLGFVVFTAFRLNPIDYLSSTSHWYSGLWMGIIHGFGVTIPLSFVLYLLFSMALQEADSSFMWFTLFILSHLAIFVTTGFISQIVVVWGLLAEYQFYVIGLVMMLIVIITLMSIGLFRQSPNGRFQKE